MSKQYVEKPGKVQAEQFAGAAIAGVCTAAAPVGVCTSTPFFPDWRPHVHTPTGIRALQIGDWITFSVVFPADPPRVLTDPEFQELYGHGGGGPNVLPTEG